MLPILFLLLFVIFANYKIRKWKKKGLSKGFEEVKDLVRGTIVAKVDQLWEAYQHFSELQGVEIIEIKSLKKVEMLQNITVLFVY